MKTSSSNNFEFLHANLVFYEGIIVMDRTNGG